MTMIIRKKLLELRTPSPTRNDNSQKKDLTPLLEVLNQSLIFIGAHALISSVTTASIQYSNSRGTIVSDMIGIRIDISGLPRELR